MDFADIHLPAELISVFSISLGKMDAQMWIIGLNLQIGSGQRRVLPSMTAPQIGGLLSMARVEQGSYMSDED